MKKIDGWWWPEGEAHMLDWMADPKNRVIINGRSSYQGKKQLAALGLCVQVNPEMRTAIDVGAHIGLWSFNLANWFREVCAFEPVEDHRDCFSRNVIDPASMAQSIHLYPYAVGEREDMVHIRVNPTSTGDSWVKGKGDVKMITLDSLNLQDVDFLKVDCEGYEEFVIRGAADTIAKWKPVICIEQKRDMASKFGLQPQGGVELLKRMGYSVERVLSGDYLMIPST